MDTREVSDRNKREYESSYVDNSMTISSVFSSEKGGSDDTVSLDTMQL